MNNNNGPVSHEMTFPEFTDEPATAMQMTRNAAVAAIRLYQRTLSPDHGIFASYTAYGCKFFPSCSEYTAQAILKKGVLRGSAMGAARIIRCNPFTKGGIDEVK